VARSEIIKRQREGGTIPDAGPMVPTARRPMLQGTMAPAGGYKGVGLALLVEILAAAATGATLSVHASPFSGNAGGPPTTGQFFIALSANDSSNGAFADRLRQIVAAFADQPGAHLPGQGRLR
jgi:(2R)-3-sulfolactate dehydrogenase (NADP+)